MAATEKQKSIVVNGCDAPSSPYPPAKLGTTSPLSSVRSVPVSSEEDLSKLTVTSKDWPSCRAVSQGSGSPVLRLSGGLSLVPSLSALSFSSLSQDFDSPLCKSSSQIRQQRVHRTKRKQTVVNKYCEEMNELNEAANSRPRNALIHSIQQENRHIRELQRENKELRLALEEHQNIMELIMSKYRQQIAKLVSVSNGPNPLSNSTDQMKLASQMEKITEMVAVMRRAALLGEDEYCDQQRTISTLAIENKGLREMLQIACKSGSIPSVAAAIISSDAHTQTDLGDEASSRDDLSPELDSPNGFPGTTATMNGLKEQS